MKPKNKIVYIVTEPLSMQGTKLNINVEVFWKKKDAIKFQRELMDGLRIVTPTRIK